VVYTRERTQEYWRWEIYKSQEKREWKVKTLETIHSILQNNCNNNNNNEWEATKVKKGTRSKRNGKSTI